MSFQLSANQRATAAALVSAVLPPNPPDSSSVNEGNPVCLQPELLVTHLENLLARSPATVQRHATRLLGRLERPRLDWLRGRIRHRFSSLSAPQREQQLVRLLSRGTAADRLLLSGILKLIHYHAYASPSEPAEQLERVWQAVGYQAPITEVGRLQLPSGARVRSDQEVFAADYLVVGSGAAGSVMAAELAETGRSVILAEAGPLPRATELGHSEALANRLWLESQGTLPCPDLPLQLLSGRAVGGGTVLNWGTCIPTPPELLGNWRDRAGFNAACSEAWEHSAYAVRRRLELAPAANWNRSNQLLQAAAKQLGWSYQVTERNQGSCRQCQTCSFGCPAGKQDALRTYLLDAERLGVHLLPECRVELLEGEQGKVEVARGSLRDAEGQRRPIEFRFRQLVLAGGAIHTPALLQRSGLGNAHVGRHLQLHPAAIVLAEFESDTEPWAGPAQAIVCDQFGRGHPEAPGFRLETVPLTPGLLALSLPWHSAREHRRTMQRTRRIAGWLVLVHDLAEELGSVTLNATGQPLVRYRLTQAVREAISRGIIAAATGLRAAGAIRLFAPALGLEDLVEVGNEHAFSSYLTAIKQAAGCSANLRLFSAHQMSSCRLASSAARGAVDPSGRLFGWQNVFVCDGSALPSSTGVNPALTIATLSHYLAQQIKRRTN